jgi:hypothetical protein
MGSCGTVSKLVTVCICNYDRAAFVCLRDDSVILCEFFLGGVKSVFFFFSMYVIVYSSLFLLSMYLLYV